MNSSYNIPAGGVRGDDLELRRQDAHDMDSLGAPRIPDPTTAGDFTRRFQAADSLTLQECINRTRQRVCSQPPRGFPAEAYVAVDGTSAGTLGKCKGGLNMSCKGIGGYAPLIVSLTNTNKVLSVVNRPGNAGSHAESVEGIDRAMALVRPQAGFVTVRGDTDFTHPAHRDRWDAQGPKFLLGRNAHAKVVGLAEALAADD